MGTTTAPLAGTETERTYQAMAPLYDELTAHHDYENWLDNLLPAALDLGLQGKRLLDVACGTGKSFMPLLDQGWQVTACDLSEAMIEEARQKARGRVQLAVADMRSLPTYGSFDLVLCLGDAVNYLLSTEELQRCLAGMRRNLAREGLLLFDTNTLLAYRTFYVEPYEYEAQGRRYLWRGLASPTTSPGSEVEGHLERQEATDDDQFLVVHRQRHHTPAALHRALDRAGLECLGTFGHHYDAVLEQPLDEARHTKAVYIARRKSGDDKGGE